MFGIENTVGRNETVGEGMISQVCNVIMFECKGNVRDQTFKTPLLVCDYVLLAFTMSGKCFTQQYQITAQVTTNVTPQSKQD